MWPSRANIYDRLGSCVVAQADATAVGLYPDQVDPAQRISLFATLSDLTGVPAENHLGHVSQCAARRRLVLTPRRVAVDRIASQFNRPLRPSRHCHATL